MFYPLALIITIASLGVVVLRNPLYSALSLVLTLLAVAGVFALLDAHFLAVVQIIIYAGAIMVLFIFVLMLLNVKQEVFRWQGVFVATLAALTGAGLLLVLVPVLQESTGVAAVNTMPVGSVENMGKLLFEKYLFLFEFASILIMAALVGAVMLGRKRV